MRMYKRSSISQMTGLTRVSESPVGYVQATVRAFRTNYGQLAIQVVCSVGPFILGACPQPQLTGGEVWATDAGTQVIMNIPCRQDKALGIKTAIEALRSFVFWVHDFADGQRTAVLNTGVVTGYFEYSQYVGASWYTVSWTSL